jgi:hypothetical protein
MAHVLRKVLDGEWTGEDGKTENGNWGWETGKLDGIWSRFPLFPSTSVFFLSDQWMSYQRRNTVNPPSWHHERHRSAFENLWLNVAFWFKFDGGKESEGYILHKYRDKPISWAGRSVGLVGVGRTRSAKWPSWAERSICCWVRARHLQEGCQTSWPQGVESEGCCCVR